MIRPRLFLAITLIVSMTASNLGLVRAAQKQSPPPKGGWAASEAPTTINDPAYAAYDAGDYMLAMRLATESAARGELQAGTLIGDMYEQGLGVKRDYMKAAEWFTKAAVAGDMHAQFRLGVMLAEGRGIKKDKKKAADFFEAAAAQGHALAAYNLAQTYVEGWARPQDMQRAAFWLEKAAEKDHAQAAYDLSSLYRNGAGVPKDDAKAVALLAKAADAGHADAQVEYAIVLANGKGVKKDEVAAVSWSPDGKRIASAGGNATYPTSSDGDTEVHVWDAFTGNNVLHYPGHSKIVWSVAWSPEGSRIASASRYMTVQVWKAE